MASSLFATTYEADSTETEPRFYPQLFDNPRAQLRWSEDETCRDLLGEPAKSLDDLRQGYLDSLVKQGFLAAGHLQNVGIPPGPPRSRRLLLCTL